MTYSNPYERYGGDGTRRPPPSTLVGGVEVTVLPAVRLSSVDRSI
jgi:hypothetical protein